MTKPFLTIDQQIELLKSKNLLFKSEKNAKKLLSNIGYYKLINAYRIPFIIESNNKKLFDKGTYFEDLYNLYVFDSNLRTIVFGAATAVEISFKSHLSNEISSEFGVSDQDYLRKENYKEDTHAKSEYSFDTMKDHITKSIEKQIRNNHPAIVWYKEKHQYYPFWVVANILTIGDSSRIYGKLKEKNRINIAKNYQLPYDYLASYIIHINLIRNVCAHNDVLYRYKTINSIPQKINKVKEIYEKMGIGINNASGRYERGVNDLLATIIVFKTLLSIDDFNLFKTQLLGLIEKLQKKLDELKFNKVLKEMGLNENWKETIKNI